MSETAVGLLGEVKKLIVPSSGSKDFKTPCFAIYEDPKTCLCICCCPCVQAGLNQTAVHGGDKHDNMCKACVFGPFFNICLRKDVREKNGIAGCMLIDIACFCCCGICAQN
mgnify:CR=1 FL=1